MRKLRLNNLSVIFVLSIVGVCPSLRADTLAFLILNDGVDLSATAAQLERDGAHVQQRIPPKIMVVNVPDSIPLSSIQGVKTIHSSIIPLSSLEPLGDLAVAAGMRWNRRMLQETKASGRGMGAMRVLVAQKSLPAAATLSVRAVGSALRCSWEAVDSASYYQLEMATDAGFSQKVVSHRTNQPEADLPLPEGNGSTTLYVRVRAVDVVDPEESIMGAWKSTSLDLSLTSAITSLSAPLLISPAPNFVSEGFTLALQWNAGTAANSRVQISRSPYFQETLYDTVVAGNEFICPSPGLKVGDTLFWRVKAWGDLKSAWSEKRGFEIGAPHHAHTDMFRNPEAPK